MRIARVAGPAGTHLARIEDDEHVVPIVAQPPGPGADPLREAIAAGVDLATAPACAEVGAMADFELLAPVIAPQKLLAIGLNYADHARESGMEPPKAPVTFVKTHQQHLRAGRCHPLLDRRLDRGGLRGRAGRRDRPGRAPGERRRRLSYVLGYTLCNDVSARDAQFGDGQWVRGKSFDTFSPLGPWIVTADAIADPQDLGIRCRVNGETLQDSTTAEMIFGCAEIISYLSRVMTLEPGDVIATGTPYGVGFARTPPVYLLDGDIVDVEIDPHQPRRRRVRAHPPDVVGPRRNGGPAGPRRTAEPSRGDRPTKLGALPDLGTPAAACRTVVPRTIPAPDLGTRAAMPRLVPRTIPLRRPKAARDRRSEAAPRLPPEAIWRSGPVEDDFAGLGGGEGVEGGLGVGGREVVGAELGDR